MPPTEADRALIAGIAAYRRHPAMRDLPDPQVVWREGASRIMDFGGSGQRVLFVPSLINRSYILDLAPQRSLMRFLAANGVAPLLLDWGWPGARERGFTLGDYVAGRLERALVHASRDGAVILAGYCMGGLLATAAAWRRPECVAALVLLATPWDFHAADAAAACQLGRASVLFEAGMAATGTLGIDQLQGLFSLIDPNAVAHKYRAFGRLDQASERAAMFVAIEDWLNDGVPLAAPVARECLGGWYGRNTPARRAWLIGGLPVDPTALRLPSFVAVPSEDRIVPPSSAESLAALIPGAVLHRPAAGHIGMVAGGNARAALWQPLLEWLLA